MKPSGSLLRHPRLSRARREKLACNSTVGATRSPAEQTADELLREHYDRLKSDVIANARGKLAARNLRFPQLDLEAWYNAAWHGLYQAVVDGSEEITNPGGWLVVALERRAIDEVRQMQPRELADLPADSKLVDGIVEPDFAKQLDDLDRIRRWRSGIRLQLSKRERQAAVLHFIQGYTRVETAQALGVPMKRVDKIFDAITTKTAGLLSAIDEGTWCESERSLMVAFSAGVLDPTGERYAIAQQHVLECPGCATLVRRLRVAYVVVPAPALAGVATAAGSGALGAALGLAEVTSTGAGAGATAGGVTIFGGAVTKTAVMCASAACLTGAGASVAVVESIHHVDRPPTARAETTSKPRTRAAIPSTAARPQMITATSPRSIVPAANSAPSQPTQQAPASSPAAKPSPRQDPEAQRRARHAAKQRQQENELGIEPAGASSPPPSTSSGSTTPSTSGSTAPPSSSTPSASSSSTSSSGQSTATASPSPSPSAATGGASSGGGGSPEIGIEP
jgi:RNA polymerase sigma factor (sigma-70 family)